MHNRTLGYTMSNLDETDLCLDLDDNLSEELQEPAKKYAKVSEEENVFKKPAIQLLSEIDANKNQTSIQMNSSILPNEDDLQIFKKFEPQNQSIFDELFNNDDEDEDDEFIKNMPVLSSTQHDSAAQKTLYDSQRIQRQSQFKKPTQVI